MQVRKVILVQACVRRWLAKLKYKKKRSTAASSAVTLQRHVRGWLTRRKVHAIKERERENKERRERERQQRDAEEQKKKEKISKYFHTTL